MHLATSHIQCHNHRQARTREASQIDIEHDNRQQAKKQLCPVSPNEHFEHISFVNGIYTSKGGKHVEYVINAISRKLSEFIHKKKKIM